MEASDSLCVLARTGWLLKYSRIDEIWVSLIVLACLATGWALTRRCVSTQAIRHLLTGASAIFLSSLAVLGIVNYPYLGEMCLENNVVEWVSAGLLLTAFVFGFASVLWRSRTDSDSPMFIFLTSGFFWGFWRELEWGGPFIGKKIIYTRNLFRPGAYLSVAHFQALGERKHLDPLLLFNLHWASAVFVWLVAVVLLRYLWRRRKLFLSEAKSMISQSHGRYFLLGAGMFVGSQLLGALVREVLKTDWLADLQRTHGLCHRVVDEPLEVVAAACIMVSAVCMWRSTRAELEPARAAYPSRLSEGQPKN